MDIHGDIIGKADMRYTLRQLEVFVAVARAGGVSRAARALGLSQSAASGALADLERQFDLLLFDRIGKRLRLSPRGAALRPAAEAVIDLARDLEHRLEDRAQEDRVRVGATLTIGNYVAVPLVARFLRAHPAVALTLEIANTAEIARQVANFDLDVGLAEGEVDHPDLEVVPWREDQLVVFCGAGHPLSRRRALTDADLVSAPWIVRERGSGTRQTFDRAMHGLLPRLRVALTLRQTEAIKRAVEAGLGLGCVSRIALEDAFQRGTLKPCRVPHRDFRRQFFLLLHRRKHRAAGVERWLAFCRGER
jgi:DNA-binding transcriptional LysR family regulator